MQLRHRAIGLHALQRFVEGIAQLRIILAEHRAPDEALVDLERGDLELRIRLEHGIRTHRVAGEHAIGPARDHGLRGVRVGPVGLRLEAVLRGVVLQPLVVGRTLVGGNRLALEVVERLDVGLAGGHDKRVVRVQVTLGKEQVGCALGRHRGRRADEIELARVHRGDQPGELAREHLDLAPHALAGFEHKVDVEAFDAAAHLGHRVRREGAVESGDEGLVLCDDRT